MPLTSLDPELEAQLPEFVRQFREFYFSLSSEERERLDSDVNKKPQPKQAPSNKETKFCFECGEKINRNAKFCEHCGTKQPKL